MKCASCDKEATYECLTTAPMCREHKGSYRLPFDVIQLAVTQAQRSSCAKSKRGVVIWNPLIHDDEPYEPAVGHGGVFGVVALGFNSPPLPYRCDATERCRRAKNCARIAVHAEERALLDLPSSPWPNRYDLDLVHVKIGTAGTLVAGGPPSCDLCAKLVLEKRLGAVWLFEAQEWVDFRDCNHCKTRWDDAHLDRINADDTCPKCFRELSPTTTRVYDEGSGKWRCYSALDFYEVTLKNCGLYAVRGDV